MEVSVGSGYARQASSRIGARAAVLGSQPRRAELLTKDRRVHRARRAISRS